MMARIKFTGTTDLAIAYVRRSFHCGWILMPSRLVLADLPWYIASRLKFYKVEYGKCLIN